MTDQIKIVDAASAQLDDLAGIIGDAFAALAVSRYLVPDAAARRDLLTRHLGQFVTHAHRHGMLHTDENLTCAAVWFPAGNPHTTPEIDNYAAIRADICGPHTDRFAAFETAMHEHHPVAPRHWHLALLAVRPDRQGHGAGSSLLRHQHLWLDAQRLPAFLEASDPRSRALYQRHGYLDLGDPYPIGPQGPPMFPMWRVSGAPDRNAPGSQS